MSLIRVSVLVFLLSCLLPGQIIELRQEGGKTISCARSGLHSYLRDCGTSADWYSYVFVGVISSITPADNDEKELQLTPEEIFHGSPTVLLKVRTSQGLCLPELSVGSRWLFFLKEKEGSPLLLGYGGRSSTVESARDEIETLRRLKTLGNQGLLRGSVARGELLVETPVEHALVIAERISGKEGNDNRRFVATTDQAGRYEFQPLPTGRYKVSASLSGSFHVDDESVDLKAGQCWDVALQRSPHGRIAGHVRRVNGTPAAGLPVILFDGFSSYQTTDTNKTGFYQFDSLRPGTYVVGINLPGAPKLKYGSCGGVCESPDVSLYYPGTQRKSDAMSIVLGTDAKRTDIDLVIP